MNATNFIYTMLEEKGISLEETIELDGYFGLTVKMVIDFACSMPKNIVNNVVKTFSIIDFKNGDVRDYVQHLAKGVVQSL